MNCSILELTQRRKVTVIDQLADKSISSRNFFETCFQHLLYRLRQLKPNNNEESPENNNNNNNNASASTSAECEVERMSSQLRSALYEVMNNETNSSGSSVKETWTVSQLELNMRELGGEALAHAVLDKLKSTNLIDKHSLKMVGEIRDVLICSDAVIYEYLEPLMRAACATGTRIVFMDNDCATLGAAFLASSLLRVDTFDMLPFSIGMGLYNGVVKRIIDAKTSFPCMGSHLFQTIVTNQPTIRYFCQSN